MYRICTSLFLVAVLLTPVHGQDSRAESRDDALEKKVDDYLNPLVECGLFSGAVLVARDGKVVVHKAYGKANFGKDIPYKTASRSKLMSVTKAMTATTIMALVMEGKLDLEDTVSAHLPDFPADWNKVTLRQLLSHSSNIPNCESDWTQLEMKRGGRGIELWPELATLLADRKLVAQGSYSNFNYILLGLVAEKVAGKPFPDIVNEKVFEPAGMTQTGFDDGSQFDELAVGYFAGEDGRPKMGAQDMSRIQAAGGVYSTVGDLYRFDRALVGEKILSESIKKKMYQPTTRQFCQGWQITPYHGHRCVSHSGGANGYVADLLRFVDDDACVAVTSNLAFSPITKISRDIAGILFDQPIESATVQSEDFLEQCQGMFSFTGGSEHHLVVRQFGKTLMAFSYWPGAKQCSGRLLIPQNDGLFVGTNAQYQFTKSEEHGRYELTATYGSAVYEMAKHSTTDQHADLIGDYQSDSGDTAKISEVEGKVYLRSRGVNIFPNNMELFSLSSELVLGVYNNTGGVVLEIEEQPNDSTIVQWRKYDGTDIKLKKQSQTK